MISERRTSEIGAAAETRTWPALVFAIHALLFAALLAWSWRKWPIRSSTSAGSCTFRGGSPREPSSIGISRRLFGPLSLYVNALWFRLFGVSLTTIVICNVAIFAGVLLGDSSIRPDLR